MCFENASQSSTNIRAAPVYSYVTLGNVQNKSQSQNQTQLLIQQGVGVSRTVGISPATRVLSLALATLPKEESQSDGDGNMCVSTNTIARRQWEVNRKRTSENKEHAHREKFQG